MKRVLRSGTLPWLLRHHLLLVWREARFNRGIWGLVVFTALFFTAAPFLFWQTIGNGPESTNEITVAIESLLFWTVTVILAMVTLFSFGGGLVGSLKSFLERQDLDLLISSPIDSRVIFASRLLGIAAELFLGYCWLTVPLVPFLIFIGQIQIAIGLHTALLCVAIVTTSLSMLLTLWCIRRIGIKATRSLLQISSVAFSATFLCIVYLDGSPISTARVTSLLQQSALLAPQSWIWFPVRTVFFHGPSVCLNLGLSIGLGWITINTLANTYLQGSQQIATPSSPRLLTTKSSRLEKGFSANLHQLLLIKEWRLMLRNPMLLSQVGLHVFYLIFMFYLILRDSPEILALNVQNLVVVISVYASSNLAAILTRLCVSGEEVPDLLKTAPIYTLKVHIFKLLAALMPTWLLLSPVFLLILLQHGAWFKLLWLSLGATVTSAMLSFWNSRPIPQIDLSRRGQENRVDIVLACLQVAVTLLWGVIAFVALQTGILALLSVSLNLLIIFVIMGFAYWRYWEIQQVV